MSGQVRWGLERSLMQRARGKRHDRSLDCRSVEIGAMRL